MRFTMTPGSNGRVEYDDGTKTASPVELEVGDAPEALTGADAILRLSAADGTAIGLGLTRRELEALFELLRVAVRSPR